MNKIDSKTFREMANRAVDEVAKFLDEFPGEFYPVMRICFKDPAIAIVVGIEVNQEEEEKE